MLIYCAKVDLVALVVLCRLLVLFLGGVNLVAEYCIVAQAWPVVYF